MGTIFDWLIPSAHAQTAGAAAPGGGFGTMLIFTIMMVGLLFFMSRSQNKRVKEHQSLVDSLQRGDEIVISGGIVGRIDEIQEPYLVLEIADKVKIKVERTAVNKLLPKGSLKA